MSDLSSLFLPNPAGPAQPATFRQAVLKSFDADTAENVVTIGATDVPNVALLNTGAEIGLETGDNILVMYLGNTPMIVGKIATPGSANYGAGNAGRGGFQAAATNFASTTTGNVIISDTSLVVPGWANSAAVTVLGAASMLNNSGALNDITSQVKLICPGQATITQNSHHNDTANGSNGATNAYFSDVIAVTPTSTITSQYLVGTGIALAANAANAATFSVSIQYFRESAS